MTIRYAAQCSIRDQNMQETFTLIEVHVESIIRPSPLSEFIYRSFFYIFPVLLAHAKSLFLILRKSINK